MSERLLKILIYTAGAVCLYAFVAIRVPALYNLVLLEKVIPEYWENVKYGENYYYNNFIRHFREEGLPPHGEKYRLSEEHPTLEEADIYIFGDSFMDFTRMTTFPERLKDSLNLNTFYARNDLPLRHFSEEGFENGGKRRILIYESAERYVYFRFSEPHRLEWPQDSRSLLRKTASATRDMIFLDNTETLYQNLISRSYLSTAFFSSLKTFKFNTFNYITELTPVYSLDHETPWLFYYDQLNEEPSSFYYRHTQEEIDLYCDNIADLAEKLDEHYNMEMVFMAIPSKYTIYHKLVNNDEYNNFIPRLYEGLEKRGIPVIPVYEDFRDSEDVLYYGTDTHWTDEGLSIALNNTLRTLRTLNIKQTHYESSTASWRFWDPDQRRERDPS